MGIKKIQTQIVISITGVVIFSFVSAFIPLNSIMENMLERDLEEFAGNLLESTVNIVDSKYTDIVTYREKSLSEQREEMATYSDLVFTLLETIYERIKNGEINETEGKSEALRYISNFRFHNDLGYFWISDRSGADPKMIVHPAVSELSSGYSSEQEEDSSENLPDQSGPAVKGGYLEYTEGGKKKITYVKSFSPWNWVIGTEISLENIEQEIDDKFEDILSSVIKLVGTQKLGETGYFYVFDESNKMLVHPIYSGMDGNQFLNPETGRILMNEFKDAVKSGKKSMLYLWDKPGDEGNYTYEKKAFFNYYEPLGWYIAGSVYIKDFTRSISEQNRILLIIFIAFLILSFFLALLVSRSVVAPLNNLIREIGVKDKEGILPELISRTGPYEVQLLGKTINTMIESVRDSRSKYKNLFDNALVGIYRTRYPDGLFLEVNDTLASLIGLPKEEIVGKLTTRELHSDISQMEELDLLLQKFGEVTEMELEMNLPGDRKMICSASMKIYPDEGFIEGVVVDISRQKTAEKEKERLQEELIQRGKMDAIGQLAGGIAHDFNNMLSGIMGAAQLLNSPARELDEKSKKLVDLILAASSRASDLTAKLLSFGRKGGSGAESVDIHSVIQETLYLLEKTINKNVRIVMNLSASDLIVRGNRSGIHNALLNIGINASNAMPEGGVLSIDTKNTDLDEKFCRNCAFDIVPGKYIVLDIRDTGCGIEKENLKRIFEPFFTTRMSGKGTGLGLAAVYGTVEGHKGALEVFSEPGEGTLFRIYLPCSEKIRLPGKNKKEFISGSGTIFLVDDEEIIRSTVGTMLGEMGYNVKLAENGEEAVAIFEKDYESIDLTIIDMIMPKMNGAKAFYRMKEIDPDCRVIIASGYTEDENMDKLMARGLAGFIRKPFLFDELSRFLSEIMGNYL